MSKGIWRLDGVVECGRARGPTGHFVCQHRVQSLPSGVLVGYHCSSEDNSANPDAWCTACEGKILGLPRIYDYHCAKCGKDFEITEPMKDHATKKERCPACRSRRVERLLKPVFAKTSGHGNLQDG